jgi:hypothetical protein
MPGLGGDPVNASSGGGWQLSAELTPTSPDREDARPQTPWTSSVPPPEWREAAAGVRTTVKWMVTALAAVGAVLFAKGFITTPTLSWSENTLQLVAAWILGVTGLFGIGWLIAQAVGQLRPTVYTLGTLPAEFIRLVESHPVDYLPAGITTLAEFRTRFEHTRRVVERNKATIDEAENALEDARTRATVTPQAVRTAEEHLAAAAQAQRNNEHNFAIYGGVRQQLLARAEYLHLAMALPARTSRMILAAVIAAAGGIGYQLALATAPDSKDDGGGSSGTPARPAVGELVRSDTEAGRQVWRELGLGRCQTDPAAPRIAVVVASGKGSLADPHVVTTVPHRTCPAQTFTVIDEVALVSLPVPEEITYTPAESQPQ